MTNLKDALTLAFIASARFEGTVSLRGLVLFAAMAWLPDGRPLSGSSVAREKPLEDSAKPRFDSGFRPCCGAWCDSKANRTDKSGTSSQFKVNFSFTNQRADSFLNPGVNLEAKV